MIIKFFKDNSQKDDRGSDISLVKIISLLIHAAKLDEHYSEKEVELIKNFIITFSKRNKEDINEQQALTYIKKAEEYENNSNQILEFTKEVKKADLKLKTLVLKTLWQIVLSDDKSGVYETNLMRRICGLLYIPDKVSGEIKSDILNIKK